jgi:hypothetical protein
MAAQVPDKILLDGKQLNLYSNPLEQFWTNSKKVRPRFFTSPDCSRGYVAGWKIEANKLFLTDIEAYYDRNFVFFRNKTRYTLATLISKSKNKPVVAKWFSGKLRIPVGNMTMYEHSGYDSRFEKELIITIHEGEVIKVVTLDYMQKSLVVNLESPLE